MKAESRQGGKFVDALSADLRKELPSAKGFSRTNVFYMAKSYKLCANERAPQAKGQRKSVELIPQVED